MDVDAMMSEVEKDIQFAVKRHYHSSLSIDAEDFAQEIRMKVLMMVDKWNPNLSTWRGYILTRLHGIAVDVIRTTAGCVTRCGHVRHVKASGGDLNQDDLGKFVDAAVQAAFDIVDGRELIDILSGLDRETRMYVDYHAHGLTMKQIGERYRVVQSRVSQILSDRDGKIKKRARRLVA